MTLTNGFGQPYLTITHDSAEGWIYNEWSGLLSIDSVIEGASAGLELMRQTGCPLLLNDNRHILGSWHGANDWIAQQWMPQALAAGLRRFAHIVSPGLFGQASAEEMQRRVGNRFEMRLFQDLDAARQWLRAARRELQHEAASGVNHP